MAYPYVFARAEGKPSASSGQREQLTLDRADRRTVRRTVPALRATQRLSIRTTVIVHAHLLHRVVRVSVRVALYPEA